jgi:signal transduction histidine kinase
MSEDPDRMNRLRVALTAWLKELFGGRYDEAYWAHRAQIGRTHVQVGLSQHHMVAAMQIVWEELEATVRRAAPPEADKKLSSLHKLLMLELGAMLESYKEAYSEQVRQIERAAVRERLTRAEHLAQIGALAASLAHEIKNPLAGISGAIQVIRDAMRSNDPHRPIIAEILRQISRLDGTVKDLLVYARPKPPRIQDCRLERVIERVLAVVRGDVEQTKVTVEVTGEAPPIEADELQVEQLLLNLVINAIQASTAGGVVKLTIATTKKGARLTVEDAGHGMDAEVCRRAFEPFYTTKAKGTGLGLPICQKIAEAHGGTIAVRSAVGQGTTVSVELPRQARGAAGAGDDHPRSDR